MSRIETRGVTMSKVTHVRQVMHQLTCDERNPRTVTAQIMAEHDVSQRDVMAVCDIATDAIAQHRNAEMAAMHG